MNNGYSVGGGGVVAGGLLVNTGKPLNIIVGLAIVILVLAVLVWRRGRHGIK